MDPTLPQFTYEVVRYVPEPWFIMLITAISFVLLIVPLFSLNRRVMSWSIATSMLVFVAGSPYTAGLFPYVLWGYALCVGAVVSMLLLTGTVAVRYQR